MKVKNIVFSGFAAAIFAAGAANAATTSTQIASKSYVDNQIREVGTEVNTLQQTLENNYTTTEQLQDVVIENITNELKEDGAITKVLADKADAADVEALGERVTTAEEKIKTLNGDENTEGSVANQIKTAVDGKADLIEVTAAQAGTIAIVDANGQYQLGDVKAADLVTNNDVDEKITNALSDEGLKEKITEIVGDGTVVTEVIEKSIDEGRLKEELDKKANVEDVYTKEQTDAQIIKLAIPQPTGNCAADSGRCVLSIDTEGKGLMWLDITEPLEEVAE